MRARTKFLIQVVFAIILAFVLRYVLEAPDMYVPGIRGVRSSYGIWYIPIAVFIIVAMTNAVNLTDGLDGLAGLISATAFATYGGIALIQGQVFLGQILFYSRRRDLWLSLVQCTALPLLFMGDTGSLALGAALAVVS